MSESQDVQSTESKENSDSEGSRPRSISDDKKEFSSDGYETPKSECTTTSKSDEPEKNVGNVDTKFTKPPTNTTPTGMTTDQQQNRSGECNLLPVLVERLRSALELSCSSRNSDDQLPLEDSGVDSEEDLRNWASGLNNFIDQNETANKPKLDLKFLEDLLLSDIQTALARLQDTLKRVDIGVLTKYNSTLDPTNKLHLLRLISNLLAKLKIPEDAIKSENKEEEEEEKSPTVKKRNRSERHTIGVSSEELARARKWLEERNPHAEFDFKGALRKNHSDEEKIKILDNLPVKREVLEFDKELPNEDNNTLEKQFDQVHEKYMKDAINQQQSLQNKNRETKDDTFDRHIIEHEDLYNDQVSMFYQQPSAPKYNKFLAKKSRLKRANTIDIPNYLKVNTETNGCISLRRPIDISDKVLTNGTNVIPSFQPKTENDRKFLALINKNNETPPVTSVPFKNFNYRKNSTADKNWNNRFSNIKTAFDKQEIEENIDNRRKSSIENEIVGSLKLSYGPTKKSNGGFTHAPTSPFQKIEKHTKMDPPAFLKPGYIPKNGSNLQAKVKIFDQEQCPKTPPPPPRNKLIKNNIFQDDLTENGHHINYQTFCKQFAPKGSNYLEHAKSKFTGDDVKNIGKDSIKKMPFVSHENGPFQKSKQKLLKMQQVESYEPQVKHYPKTYEIYPVNVNPLGNIGYRYDHRSEQRTRNPPNRFEKTNDNRRRAFDKFSMNEPDRSSIGVQTGVESYQDKNRFVNSDTARRKLNNASVQTSEIYDNYKKFHYPETGVYDYQNTVCYHRRNSLESARSPIEVGESEDFRMPNVPKSIDSTGTGNSRVDPSRIMDLPKMPMSLDSLGLVSNSSDRYLEHPKYIELLTPRPLEQSGPPVPERTNYNNVLLRNYKSDQTRSKSSYYDNNDENPSFVPPIRSNSLDKIRHPSEEEFANSEEHIENQDISSDGIVTRYASAIATVASMPESSDTYVEHQKPKIPHPYPETSLNEIERHNQLQQNLSRRIQNAKSPTIQQNLQPIQKTSQEIYQSPRLPYEQERQKSPNSPSSFLFGNKATLRHGTDSDSRRTQEKISMFEEINHSPVKRHFRPLNVPRTDLQPPRINIVNPSKVIQPKFKIDRSSIVNSPVDSSDEYLMSCASKPSRNIVLTKSESWHQLAMARNTLQVPQTTSNSLLKPPKPKSPSSLRLSKQFEASSSSDNIKKMEERIQRYFQGSTSNEATKKETKNKRTMKKTSNNLMRSHTMPHLYDESTDVEKAFDCLFNETTLTDNRY